MVSFRPQKARLVAACTRPLRPMASRPIAVDRRGEARPRSLFLIERSARTHGVVGRSVVSCSDACGACGWLVGRGRSLAAFQGPIGRLVSSRAWDGAGGGASVGQGATACGRSAVGQARLASRRRRGRRPTDTLPRSSAAATALGEGEERPRELVPCVDPA